MHLLTGLPPRPLPRLLAAAVPHSMAQSQASPGGLAGLIGQLLTAFVKSGRDDVTGLLNAYLLSTTDPTHPGQPLTAVVIALFVRRLADHSLLAEYDLRSAIPRVLLAVVLMNASLSLMQMAVDLNNALSSLGAGLGGGQLPWNGPLGSPALDAPSILGDLFQVLVLMGLVLMVAFLGFAYVIRMAVLQVLVVTAPLAALALILPATRGLSRAWTRLFVVAVFMQAGQLLVLSIAAATGLARGGSLAAAIYAVATVWVALRVPRFLALAAGPGGLVTVASGSSRLRPGWLPAPIRASS
jgi:hypothetical protein